MAMAQSTHGYDRLVNHLNDRLVVRPGAARLFSARLWHKLGRTRDFAAIQR
jgi:hypothetical protein